MVDAKGLAEYSPSTKSDRQIFPGFVHGRGGLARLTSRRIRIQSRIRIQK
jgi:hypothetical protein